MQAEGARVVILSRALSFMSRVLPLDQRPAYFARGPEIVQHGLVYPAQYAPWVFAPVETVQEQEIGDEAQHPVDLRRVAQDGTAAGRFQKPPAECLSGAALGTTVGVRALPYSRRWAS